MTDQELMGMAIEERNALLDELAYEAYEDQQARLEREAEQRNEFRLAFPNDGWYAGSPEDQYERFLDSMNLI